MDVFLIEDDDLCNTNTTWDKVSAEIKKKRYSAPVCIK